MLLLLCGLTEGPCSGQMEYKRTHASARRFRKSATSVFGDDIDDLADGVARLGQVDRD